MLDEIDLLLLEECNKNPGQPLADSIKPLLGKRSRRRLYVRLYALESQHLISVDRISEKSIALATITEAGKAAIQDRLPVQGVSSS
jgi:DNA-binding PadR family transcriptional regulator